jgi:hypothetical protein
MLATGEDVCWVRGAGLAGSGRGCACRRSAGRAREADPQDAAGAGALDPGSGRAAGAGSGALRGVQIGRGGLPPCRGRVRFAVGEDLVEILRGCGILAGLPGASHVVPRAADMNACGSSPGPEAIGPSLSPGGAPVALIDERAGGSSGRLVTRTRRECTLAVSSENGCIADNGCPRGGTASPIGDAEAGSKVSSNAVTRSWIGGVNFGGMIICLTRSSPQLH